MTEASADGESTEEEAGPAIVGEVSERAEPPPAASPADRGNSAALVPRIEGLVTRAGSIAGGAAALVVFVHLVGGVVLWLRFHRAGLPADAAVAVVSRQQLLVVGLRLMVLPSIVTGALAAGLVVVYRRSDNGGAGMLSRWNKTRSGYRVSWIMVVVGVVLCGLVVPFTWASATWPLAFALVLGYWQHAVRHAESLSPWRMAAVAILAAGVVSLGRQLDEPVQLLQASVRLGTSAGVVEGLFIDEGGGSVYLGDPQTKTIRVIRAVDVAELQLGPPPERAPNRSLLSYILGGDRFSATPLEWWCNGQRYSWGDLGGLCRTQPYITGTHHRWLDSGFAPVRIYCPPSAQAGCRGYVRLTTLREYDVSAFVPPRQTVLGPRRFDLQPGRANELCLPVNAGAQAQFRGSPAGAKASANPVPMTVTFSEDPDGTDILGQEGYTLRMRNRPIGYVYSWCEPKSRPSWAPPG